MKTVEILGANRFETFSKTRAGSRAVIVRDGSILLSHETVSGWWLVPGGGLEEGETPETCCMREVEEETGFIVKPLRQFLTLNEYYEEYLYTGYFFVCEVTGKGRMRLTDVEKERGVQPEWLPLQNTIELFSMLKLNFVTGEIAVVMINQNPNVDQTELGVEQLTSL